MTPFPQMISLHARADEPAPKKSAKAASAQRAKQSATGKQPTVSPAQKAKLKQSFLTNMSAEKGSNTAKPGKSKTAADAAAGSSADGKAALKQTLPVDKADAADPKPAGKAVKRAADVPAMTAADATAAASAAAAASPDTAAAGKAAPKLVAVSVRPLIQFSAHACRLTDQHLIESLH